ILRAFADRLIDEGAGLLAHAEAAVLQRRRDIFGRLAHESELEIVMHACAIKGKGMNNAALHEVDDQWAETDFDRMGAHSQQNGSVFAVTLGHLSGDGFEMLRGKNVRQAAYESSDTDAFLKAFAE